MREARSTKQPGAFDFRLHCGAKWINQAAVLDCTIQDHRVDVRFPAKWRKWSVGIWTFASALLTVGPCWKQGRFDVPCLQGGVICGLVFVPLVVAFVWWFTGRRRYSISNEKDHDSRILDAAVSSRKATVAPQGVLLRADSYCDPSWTTWFLTLVVFADHPWFPLQAFRRHTRVREFEIEDVKEALEFGEQLARWLVVSFTVNTYIDNDRSENWWPEKLEQRDFTGVIFIHEPDNELHGGTPPIEA